MPPLFFLQWHITHACNLRCAHCYQEEYTSHMPREELFQALDQFGALLAGREVQGQIKVMPMYQALQSARKQFSDMMAQVNAALSAVLNPGGSQGGCSGNCAACGGCG